MSISGGYVCAPYLHDANSLQLKETLLKSSYIDDMYFVTATFSEDGRAYFPSYTNTYLLARFNDQKTIIKQVEKFKQPKSTFVFNKQGEFFQREVAGKLNLVSVYYLEYGKSHEDIAEVASIVGKRNKVRRAETGSLGHSSTKESKFTFPYEQNMVLLEIASGDTHQSDNKYCEKTRREVARKGIKITNLVSLSVLDKIK
jgi:TFIIF-interacting CTD phosphatase-like protein